VDCESEYFKALGNEVEFMVANKFDDFAEKLRE
jgi:hypothetical protein